MSCNRHVYKFVKNSQTYRTLRSELDINSKPSVQAPEYIVGSQLETHQQIPT